MFPRKRLTPLPAAAPAGAAALSTALLEPPMAQKTSQFRDVDTQPLWFRARIPGNQAFPGRTSMDLFTQRKNQAPHLTNLEEVGAMPNSAEFFVAALELVKQPGASESAYEKLLANTRLIVEVGTKNFERVNQPAALFLASGASAGAGNVATIRQGLYTLKMGEEIHLAADQPFRIRLEMDDDGMALAAGEDLDFLCILRGQKRSRVSVG